jgi:hypothetical protein
MSLLRAIPIDVHAALEVVAAPLLFVAPFALGFSYLAGALSIVLGILLIGLGTSVYGGGDRGNLPLGAHAGFDYTLAAATIVAGVVAGIGGDYVATVFFGRVRLRAQMALTASTRFSVPRGA